MKKITLNETDLLKIVNKVLNEQKIRQFDEDEIDLLHLIFERELKPPFSKRERNDLGITLYYDRDDEWIGWLSRPDKLFTIHYTPFLNDIKDKVCQVFEFPSHTGDWWFATKPHLISWVENQINTEIRMN